MKVLSRKITVNGETLTLTTSERQGPICEKRSEGNPEQNHEAPDVVLVRVWCGTKGGKSSAT